MVEPATRFGSSQAIPLEKAGECWAQAGEFLKAATAFFEAAKRPDGGASQLLKAMDCWERADEWTADQWRKAAILWEQIAASHEVHRDRVKGAYICYATAGDFALAARAIEAMDPESHYLTKELHDAAGKLWERAGNMEEAIASYKRASRLAKISRIKGTAAYAIEETVRLYNFLEPDYCTLSHLRTLYWSLGERSGGHAAALYLKSGDKCAELNRLRKAEGIERQRGRWIWPLLVYFHLAMWDEFERVCREEDELDVAAYLYEKAGKTDDAARIYEEMAGKQCDQPSPSRVAREEETRTASAIRECPSCSLQAQAGDKFCRECGCGLGLVCSECSAELRGSDRFCSDCGHDLEATKETGDQGSDAGA